MKTTKKRLFSFVMAMAMLAAMLLPASASEVQPYAGDRFKYYTVTDKDWKRESSFTVTAEESEQMNKLEDKIWAVIHGIGSFVDLDSITGEMEDYIRENNLDATQAGTYTIYSKSRTRYKKHLLTGRVYVEWEKKIVRIDFVGGGQSNSREFVLTLR